MDMPFAKRLTSDFAYAKGALGVLRRVTPIAKSADKTLLDALPEWADRWSNRPALVSERETLTYAALISRSYRYTRWALEQGLKKGDCVALLMPNRPEYMAIWFGLARAGIVTALVNTNLIGRGLAHSVDLVTPKAVIVEARLLTAFEGAVEHLRHLAPVWVHGSPNQAYLRIDETVADLSDAPIAKRDLPRLSIEDRCLYIYTSGTTGHPKAAVINHYRVQAVMHAYSAATEATRDDRNYVAQPMYHTAGGVIAPGIVLTVGGTCVISETFSATRFWDDVVKNDCTMFQYIGEMCRYLVNAPPSEAERRHRIRICNGNGLRPDVWTAFQARFRIPRILEWFAATEGNVVLFNFDGKPGSIGRIPWWLKHKFMTKLVRFDPTTEKPMRDIDGRCVECAVGEVGEAIGRILIDPTKPGQRFDGYAEERDTAAKILTDVFETGDRWFRTGDLMRQDKDGYFYFIDRIGDTFRWKSQNVSTMEVAEVVTAVPGVRECTVYGVQVPGYEGRAGMAAMVVDADFDMGTLAQRLKADLPCYARPLFLRLRTELDVTGTFKQRKVTLTAEGFDPTHIAEPLYVADDNAFIRIDLDCHGRIVSGALRL
jgi:fatty-acyl-CoA synthase